MESSALHINPSSDCIDAMEAIYMYIHSEFSTLVHMFNTANATRLIVPLP